LPTAEDILMAREEMRAIKSSSSSTLTESHSRTGTEIVAALPYHNAETLLALCKSEKLSIAQIVFKNELQWRDSKEIIARTVNLWNVM
jgi:hypothetical protein